MGRYVHGTRRAIYQGAEVGGGDGKWNNLMRTRYIGQHEMDMVLYWATWMAELLLKLCASNTAPASGCGDFSMWSVRLGL